MITRLLFVLAYFIFSTDIYAQQWYETQKILPEEAFSNTHFGDKISISDEWAIIGVPYDDVVFGGINLYNAGAAYILKKNYNGMWEIVQRIVASDPNDNDEFGYSVDINNDHIIVGARNEEEDSNGDNPLFTAGATYVFTRNHADIWEESQKLVPQDRSVHDNFGCSVSISGSCIIIGSLNSKRVINGFVSELGAAYVFEKDNDDNWFEAAKLIDSTNYERDGFGESVGINGNYAIVGASNHKLDSQDENPVEMAGATYFFERTNGKWIKTQKVVANDRSIAAKFGTSTSIYENYAIIGSIIDKLDHKGLNPLEYAGSAYIFKKNENGIWTQMQKIVPSDRSAGDQFGASVDIYENRVIIGAPIKEERDSSQSEGAVYLFNRNSNDYWYEEAKLKASDKARNDWFGWSVAIWDSTIMIGAKNTNECINGIDTLPNIGCAYLFQWMTITGLDYNDSDIIINGYPNPTKGNFTLILSREYPSINLAVSNIQGQIISKYRYSKLDKIDFKISGPPGIYFVRISSPNAPEKTIRLIKQ